MVIFTHVAKTSGSSFVAGVRSSFPRAQTKPGPIAELGVPVFDLLRQDQSRALDADFVAFHWPYGVHRGLTSDSPPVYITIFRDPVQRSISAIRHAVGGYPTCALSTLILGSDSTVSGLTECVRQDIGCNIMTKQLSGLESMDNIALDEDERLADSLYSVRHANRHPYTDSQMRSLLEAATTNVVERYHEVAFQDEGATGHRRLARRIGATYLEPERRLKQTRDGGEIGWTDRAVLDLLHEMNRFDLELYRAARARWDDNR